MWPDHDTSGAAAALTIAGALKGTDLQIVQPDPEWPEHYDIADLKKAGWDTARTLAWIESRAMPAADVPRTVKPASSVPDFDTTDGDILVADYIFAEHGKDLLWCNGLGWMVWDGRRYRRDVTGEIIARAERTVRDFYMQRAALVRNDDNDAAYKALFKKWTQLIATYSRVEPVKGALAFMQPRCAVTIEQLDSDPYALNVANGTIDLRTGKLRPHDRADRITKITDIHYDPAAEASRWKNFLNEIFNKDDTRVKYVQRSAGYSFTGNVTERDIKILLL